MCDQIQSNPTEGLGRKNKRIIIMLAACIALILIATLFGSMIQTAGWKYTVEDLRGASNSGKIKLTPVDDPDPTVAATEKSYNVKGSVQSGILFTPKAASPENKRPAIVLTHGLFNNREMQLQNAIELVRRGYVVMVIDHKAHGHNTAGTSSYGGFSSDTFMGAANYMYNLPYVDQSKIAVTGHSMGGGATTSALRDDARIAGKRTDVNFAAGKNMGIITAGLVQANNAPSTIGENVIAVGVLKASADEFFFNSTTKEPVYVPQSKESVTEDNYVGLYLKKGDEYVEQTAENKFRPNKQYYKLTTSANTIFYLQSRQAVTFTGRDYNTLDDWTTVNGGIYIGGELKAQPDGRKLVSVARKGEALASPGNQIRVVYEAKETHPMNHFSTKSAAHLVDFFYNAFGKVEGVRYLAPTNQTWWLKEVFSIFGFLGLFGMILPLIDIALQTKLFASLKGEPSEAPVLLTKPRKHVSYWLAGILTCWYGAWSLENMTAHERLASKISGLFAASEGFIYANISSIAIWGIYNAVFAVIVTAVIWLINRGINVFVYGDDFASHDEHPFAGFRIRSWQNAVKTLVLAGLLVGVFYGIIHLIWDWAVVDFRFWTFDLRVFEPVRIVSMLKYVPYFFIFYMVSAALSQNYRVKDLPEWATIAINVVFNVAGYMIMMWYYNSYFIRVGAMSHASNNLFFIACYPVIPCVAVATVLARRIYVRTGNAWLAGLINATIMTFLACANTSINAAVAWTYGA